MFSLPAILRVGYSAKLNKYIYSLRYSQYLYESEQQEQRSGAADVVLELRIRLVSVLLLLVSILKT